MSDHVLRGGGGGNNTTERIPRLTPSLSKEKRDSWQSVIDRPMVNWETSEGKCRRALSQVELL